MDAKVGGWGRRLALALLTAGLAGGGCTGERLGESLLVVERDSAGIHIVENPAEALDMTLSISSEPTLSVGVVDGAPEYQFYRVGAAARLSDGGVVVANGGSREVRIYGPDGLHRVTVGGAGQGPAEFRYPAALVVRPGDTIEVQDFVDRVRFAPDGTFLGRSTTQMGDVEALTGPDGFSEGGVWVPDGTMVLRVYLRDAESGPPTAGPSFRPRLRLLRAASDLRRADTLGEFGGVLQQYVRTGTGARGVSAMVLPFWVSTSVEMGAPDGTVLVADSDEPQFHLFGSDGTHAVVRWPVDRERVTVADVEAWKERRRAVTSQDALPRAERGWAELDTPDRKPAHGPGAAMGRDGSIWLQESSNDLADPAAFLVFTPAGHLRGRAVIPGPFQVFDAGPDWVLGVWRDENQVEYLRMYRVTAPS